MKKEKNKNLPTNLFIFFKSTTYYGGEFRNQVKPAGEARDYRLFVGVCCPLLDIYADADSVSRATADFFKCMFMEICRSLWISYFWICDFDCFLKPLL